MRLKVVESWGTAAIQGKPKPGKRHWGVPPGGAYDRESHALACALAGVSPSEPALEFATTAFGDKPFLRLNVIESGHLSICGADVLVSLNGVQSHAPIRLKLSEGDALALRIGRRGLRTYLSGGSGLKSEGKVWVWDQSLLSEARRLDTPSSLQTNPLRFLASPEMGLEPGEQLSGLIASPMQSRVGLRLEGWQGPSGELRRSEPSAFGVIQAAGDTLIIHGPDGPTTGGYQRLGGVIQADLPKLGQIRPGQQVELKAVSFEEAKVANDWAEQDLECRLALLRLLLASE